MAPRPTFVELWREEFSRLLDLAARYDPLFLGPYVVVGRQLRELRRQREAGREIA